MDTPADRRGPEEDRPAVIKVRERGPYKVSGSFLLVDADGEPIPVEGDDIVLCRCGASATKPFCDRSHRHVTWD